MRILMLGGTGWLGGEIAARAVAGGAEVVCLARGESGDVPDGAELVRADRRRPDAYDRLSGDWDAVVELAHDPALVGPALDALADRAAHWTLISSVSVYADDATPGADETAEVVEPEDLDRYPDAKVAAERATSQRVGDRLLIARPGLIAGPGDPSDRLGYWPARLDRGGRVLTPIAAGRFVQFIDVADLAQWVVDAGAERRTGVVDAVGSVSTMEAFLAAAARAAGFEGALVAASDEELLAHDVRYWAGPRALPLWLPAANSGFAQRDGSAFLAAGGSVRPLDETLALVLADERGRGVARSRRSGLTAAEEADVLAALDRRRAR
jgi:2'-hydroxyisoflavone reductase